MSRESEQEVEYKVEFWQNLEKKRNIDNDFPPLFVKYGSENKIFNWVTCMNDKTPGMSSIEKRQRIFYEY